MRDADIGCSLGASDALTTARLQGDPAAAALLLQLQEYIHSQGFNLLLVIQLLTIIGLVALAIWVRENIANICNKDMDAEHPTTCFELLRQGRVVIAGLESEVARLQVQVRDLNDNLKLKQQDGGHDTQSLQRDFDCLRLAAEAEAHDSDLAAAGSQFRATGRSSVEGGTSTEHALKKSKSFENMVAIFGTPPLFSPLAAPSRTSYVDQARVPQSRTTSLGRTTPTEPLRPERGRP